MILSAQAVPTAALLPCIAALPSGRQAGSADISSGKARLWLDSDRAGPQAVTVTLTATCDTSDARQTPPTSPARAGSNARSAWRPISPASASTPSPAAASPTSSTSGQEPPGAGRRRR